jgi:deoxyribonuclease IV
MKSMLFGISGLPIGDGDTKFTYSSAIAYLKSIGLDAMELPFVRSVNVTAKNKDDIFKAKNDNSFYLSAHGSYYINLNAAEIVKQEQSLERIIKCAEGLKNVNGRSLVFHPGFYLDKSKNETYETIKQNLMRLPDIGVNFRLETTGKPTQFGDLEELVSLCRDVPNCRLCIDFSHIHARNGGALRTYDNFIEILEYIKSNLGIEAIEDMHIHISGINYGPKGEKNHLPLNESDFNYRDCIKALKDYKASGCIICESPILENDALLLKETYLSI